MAALCYCTGAYIVQLILSALGGVTAYFETAKGGVA
jgi:hypothetical protein